MFLKYFFGVLTQKQKRHFFCYIILLFIGSISSTFGVGAVVPLVTILIEPDKLKNVYHYINISYYQLVLCLIMLLIFSFWIKNLIFILLLYFQTKFLNTIVENIQCQLFSKYVHMKYENHLYLSTPALIRNINNETTQFSGGVMNPMGMLITDLFSVFFIVIVLFMISFTFTLIITVSLLIFLLLFVKLTRNKSKFFGIQRSEAWKIMTKSTLDALHGIKEVKLYHRETGFIKNFNHKAAILQQSTTYYQFYQQMPKMVIEAITVTVVMVVLAIFIYLGEAASQIFIILSVFGVASAQLLPALTRIMGNITSIRYSMPSLVTIHSELTSRNHVFETDNINYKAMNIDKLEYKNEIFLSNISYYYADGTHALNNVSCSILKGQRTAIIGSSGAGKSTLVDLLLGFYEPQEGSILLDGNVIKSQKEKLALQKLFAYIPQQIILFDASIRENVGFGIPSDEIDDEKVLKCLEMAQLKNYVLQLPDKLNTFIGEGGIRLSGGQRQRLGIARALYLESKILVMDEATSALDSKTETELTNMINRLTNITIVTIAHRVSTIKDYDSIYVLESGKVKHHGTYSDLVARKLLD